MFINDNGLMAVERNFFDNFPNLKYLYANGNGCVNKNFERIEKIEDILVDFEECFDNWDRMEATTDKPEPTTIEPTTTTTTVTTTPGSGTKIQISIFVLIFGIFIVVL